jgi:hypothetical protein
MSDSPALLGALAGWRRTGTDSGCVLELQLVASKQDFEARNFIRVDMALNDRQLRSLARDLARAAEERGVRLWGKKPRWRLPWRR